MAKQPTIIFCDNCSEKVEAFATPKPGGGIQYKCSICGSTLHDKVDDTNSVGLNESGFIDESVSFPGMDTILTAGYSPSIRGMLLDKITEKQIAKNAEGAANGEEMIVKVIDAMNGSTGKIDLLITDVPMPFLNGINAAIGLRAIEHTYKDHDLIPVLFLTNKACDDTFKKVIRFLAPAKYATLGPIDDKQKLEKHLHRVISLIAREEW
jgi:CheY-like chemotaxis protein